MEQIIFYILAAIIIVFAIAAVSSRKILRAVVYLLFVLMAIAGIYFLINFNFLGALQLAIYAGGIVVLIIFSVLLTHHIGSDLEVAPISKRIMAALLSILGITTTLFAIYTYNFKVSTNFKSIEVSDIGFKLLSYGKGGFVLPFEVISILLLAVLIGAIVIAKGQYLIEEEHKKNKA